MKACWIISSGFLGVAVATGTAALAGCGLSTGSTSTTTTSSETDGGDNSPTQPSPAPSGSPGSADDAGLEPVVEPVIDAGSGGLPTVGPTSPPPACGGFDSTIAACNTCTQTSCCAEGSACGASAACEALFACIKGCASGDTSCEDACQTDNPDGVTPLSDFLNCLSVDCESACGGGLSGPTAGIGDPCQSTADCATGECNGHWCTKTCTSNTDCVSTSQSITNSVGQLVWCVESAGGTNLCFPGCSSNAECSGFGSGVSCSETTVTNGSATDICAGSQ